MKHDFRIAPNKPLIIEWRADLPDARWCFFMVTDSPNEAKRILAALSGAAQPLLLSVT